VATEVKAEGTEGVKAKVPGTPRPTARRDGSYYHSAGANWYSPGPEPGAHFPMGFWIGAVIIVVILFIVGRTAGE